MPPFLRGSRSFALAGVVVAALGLAVPPAATPAAAQYFGQNKVQYQNFEFRTLHTEHFDIYFYPEEREAAELAARSAERWYARLSTLFNHKLTGRQPVIVYGSAPAFQQTNAIQGFLGEGTGGVTEALKRRIVLPIGGPLREMDHVMGHELVHAFQYDVTGRPAGGARGGLPGASWLPLWFIEGMAEYFSLGADDPQTAMWMRDAAKHRIPSFRQLDDPRFFPYRFGQAFLAWIGGNYGDAVIPALLRAGGRTRSMDAAIRQVLRVEPDTLVARWHAATRAAAEPVAAATRPAAEYGRQLVGPKKDEAQYNVSPSISPDGRWVMFLSNRGFFSIDLYQADARTGEIVRRLTRTDNDPHLQSLQFIYSAGAWSDDGRRFVIAAVSGGRPILRFYDAERGRTEREVKLDSLSEIFHPAWSPDGRSVAFSALTGGLSNLWSYEIESGRLRRLTNDAYADLQPDWSPDGRTIAFATDRFTTRLDSLIPGNYEIALIDVASGEVRRAGAAPGTRAGGKQINPQWSPDGRSLYYITDRTGISNLHRLDVESGRDEALTNLFTGVSGVTAVSPALSVAARSGALAFSVFENNGHAIHLMDSAPALPPSVAQLPPGLNPGTLPPPTRDSSGVLAALGDETVGLPSADTALRVAAYRGGLSLDYIGQPNLAIGSSEFGTYVGGGAALYFSDMLGNHNLVTGLQVAGGLKDISALVGYSNLTRRINWGVTAEQSPYRSVFFQAGTAELDGETVYAEQILLERQTNRALTGILAYPFSPAQRVELSLGYQNIDFSREVETQAFSLQTGALVLDRTDDLDAPPDLNLGVGSLALVYDNSIFGATGPLLGQRYRLEVSPWIGSLDIVNALVDYRRYFLPVRPFTVAVRFTHIGRYGADGEDTRLTPLFLGYDGLVRGYSFDSFDSSECFPSPGSSTGCPVLDRLVGSRIALANLELRFPLFGVLGVGSGYYGAFPVDFAVFGDAGVAWTKADDPTFFGGDRKPVYSIGAGLRLNLFGFAVAQINAVHPFDRPQRNVIWQFSLLPGF